MAQVLLLIDCKTLPETGPGKSAMLDAAMKGKGMLVVETSPSVLKGSL